MSRAVSTVRDAGDSYFELVKRFPLRRIRSAAERNAATAIVRELGRRGEARLDRGEIDYLDALAKFIAEYEASRCTLAKATPLDILKHLMEQQQMRSGDLGKLIGPSAATMVLRGQRELSKSHIRKLAGFFRVNPGVFI